LKIAFIHSQDINDKNLWSGTIYFIFQNLVKKFNDVVLFRPTESNSFILKLLFSGIEHITKKLTGEQSLNLYYSIFLPKAQAQDLDNFVNRNPVDFIISTTNTPFIFSKNKTPFIIITDATVKLLYEEYSGGKGWSVLFHKDLERNALKVAQKSALIVSSSSMTTNSLINDYNIPAAKIATIPFGANIEDQDIQTPQRRVDKNKQVNLLFVGKDWERKGGDFAVLVCDELVKQNINVHLDIVGCKVPEISQRTYLNNHIYLDKNKNDDFSKLKELYSKAHFFMVFSKAEMYGIVFCEAAAYGLPVVTYAIGGITDIVVNEKTGIMLPVGTTSEIFTTKIIALVSDPEKYQKMSEEARKRYESQLNWNTFTDSLKSKIFEIINPRSSLTDSTLTSQRS
jgi:glycosyltransferase involved in cell wall biosynthesis